MNKINVPVKAKFTSNKTGKCGDDPIVARCGIIVEIYQRFSCGVADFILYFLDEGRNQGIPTGATPILAWVKEIVMFGVTDQMTPLGLQKEIVVGLVNVYDSEAMNFGIAWVFLDHNIYNILPTAV